jgi:undecaprenyl diphosphate synthase
LEQIHANGVPRHVAIIMDGNGRWARGRGYRWEKAIGRGVDALRRAVRFAGRRGIQFLHLVQLFLGNWSRPH